MEIKRRSKKKTTSGVKAKRAIIEFISTGCTWLDLALSVKGRRGGVARGRVINIVGDGSAGKTLLALEIAAWCYHNIKRVKSRIFPKVKQVIIVFNNVEGVMDFPLETLFGRKFAKSIEWVRISISEHIGNDMQRRVKSLKKGDFLLYITDSWDGVKPLEEAERFEQDAQKDRVSGDGYGMTKQKWTHNFFRNITDSIYGDNFNTTYDYQLEQKDVTIIVTSQIRQKIGATKFEKGVYRIGGAAFDFWTHQVIWLYKAGKIQPERQGKKVTIGVKVRAVIERNKCKAPWKEARFPILFDYGIDNVGSMVDFVFGAKAKGFKWGGIESNVREKFIGKLEDADRTDEFKQYFIEQWHKHEDSAKVVRRPKYDSDS